MNCPRCGFPIHADQPVLRVHMGTEMDAQGYVVDLLPAFHKTCAAAHLIARGRAKTEALRTRAAIPALSEREAS